MIDDSRLVRRLTGILGDTEIAAPLLTIDPGAFIDALRPPGERPRMGLILTTPQRKTREDIEEECIRPTSAAP